MTLAIFCRFVLKTHCCRLKQLKSGLTLTLYLIMHVSIFFYLNLNLFIKVYTHQLVQGAHLWLKIPCIVIVFHVATARWVKVNTSHWSNWDTKTVCSSSVVPSQSKRLLSSIKAIAALSILILSEKDRFEFPNIRVSTKVSFVFLSCGIKSKFGSKARRVDTLAINVILGMTKLGQAMKKWIKSSGLDPHRRQLLYEI